MEIGTTSTSPQSAIRSRSNGWTFSTGCHGLMSDDCSRTARGPNRAPVRYETPPSYGIPTSATSSRSAVATAGRSMNVATWPNRGDTKASRGSGWLTPVDLRLERRPQLGDGGQEVPDLVGRVEDREARTRGPDDAEPPHQRHRTVMAGPHRDPVGIQQRGHVVGMKAR